MGFGFDQLNLDVIGWDATLTNSKNIYGTAFSYRDNEILKIPNQIGYLSAGEKKAVGHNAKKRVIKNIDCLQLLRDYF